MRSALSGALASPLGGGQPLDDRLQHGLDVLAGLGRDRDGVGGVEPDHLLDLLLDAVGVGGRQVDLVEDGQDLEVVVERLVDVGERLRLHALAGVHHQDGALAGRQRARHLVGEVDVAGRVHQVELIGLAVLGLVVEAHGLRLDGDAALALDVHGIQDLVFHLPVGDVAAQLDEPVGERRLAMVDMGDDREVADEVGCCHGAVLSIAGARDEQRTVAAGRRRAFAGSRQADIQQNRIHTDAEAGGFGRINQGDVAHCESADFWRISCALSVTRSPASQYSSIG